MDKLISELTPEELGRAVTKALIAEDIYYLNETDGSVVIDGDYQEATLGAHLKRVLLTPPPAPAEETSDGE